MKSPYLPAYDQVELPKAAVTSSNVRANLRQIVLVLLGCHLGFFSHLFLRTSPTLQEEHSNFTEKEADEAFSMEALENLVEKLPEDGFRACLQMVIGTAYAERCDELTLHLRPFMNRLMRDLQTEDTDQAPLASPDESAESDEKPRKRKKQKKEKPYKLQKPQDGLLITSISPNP